MPFEGHKYSDVEIARKVYAICKADLVGTTADDVLRWLNKERNDRREAIRTLSFGMWRKEYKGI